ncbi:hypothetical protein SERLADRAFT_466293 [Serpula lacrymans var. lacrymans S7.9]|uniref:gluconokinase n=1 Tax=Serpula lacrymans var. lacrymans (strain S7.9) TaxID=578457 RepID=F8NTR3_SERL9|nr:uncharacterized protein SERLADRAFT_466293 [Serpula lacrymans var. lacrymans S7.9]EGO25733.1 hypothetical protein SERLADRAFT_466293 [Serpula lacrymans var. lacrymans S7.9]
MTMSSTTERSPDDFSADPYLKSLVDNDPKSYSDGNPLPKSTPADPQSHQTANHGIFIVVMGVSGTGKSTLGAALSEALHVPFIDGDDLHPKSNVEKMSRGEPLTDEDRAPWLEIIRTTAHKKVQTQRGEDPGEIPEPESKPETEHALEKHEAKVAASSTQTEARSINRPGIIIACSALKKTYRALLRGHEKSGTVPSHFVSPHSEDLPTYFVFMKGGKDVLMDRMEHRKGHFMKAKMLESQLETLESPEDEEGVVTVPIEMTLEEQVKEIKDGLEKFIGESL